MKKHIIISFGILLTFLLMSCSWTKFVNYTGRNPRLVKKSNVIFMPINGLSEFASQSRFMEAKKELAPNFNKILYLPIEEINIFQKGISMEIAREKKYFDSLKVVLKEHFDIDYIIEIDFQGAEQGDIYTYNTARDLQYSRNQDKDSNTAKLLFTIHRIKQNTISSKFQVSTSISPLIWKRDDGTQIGVNLSTKNMAINTAFRKGVRKIKKKMVEGVE